ncbi:hypothetical protein R1flu_013602 [Riccia fluitans]|uniref:Uncharacterized protein n=1 Tax=Riccia fluitans TaxID=41844 RepID=A0ABD1YDQ3_9MARC
MERVLHGQTDPYCCCILHTALPLEKEKPYGLFSKKFLRHHGAELLGTTTTWFFLDVAYYFLEKMVASCERMSALEETFRVSRAQALS